MQISSDGRLRDQYMYCGADRTGRWAAGGVQLQNLTAKGPKSQTCKECGHIAGLDNKAGGILGDCPACGSTMIQKNADWTVDCVEYALADIKRHQLEDIEKLWGDPGTLLAGCLRGLFVAAPGKRLICCDFSAIEAVVSACLSRCQWRIDVFRTHGRIYEASIAESTGTPLQEILDYKRTHGMHHPLRKRGKVRELAGGFQGWISAWKNFGADEFMTDDEIKDDILQWRADSPEIVEMWGGQYRSVPNSRDSYQEYYGLEGAAIMAILNPGQCFSHYEITYGMRDDILYCRLPSG